MGYVHTDTFVFILFPRILKYVSTWFFKWVIEFSLRSLIIIRHDVIFKIINDTVFSVWQVLNAEGPFPMRIWLVSIFLEKYFESKNRKYVDPYVPLMMLPW